MSEESEDVPWPLFLVRFLQGLGVVFVLLAALSLALGYGARSQVAPAPSIVLVTGWAHLEGAWVPAGVGRVVVLAFGLSLFQFAAFTAVLAGLFCLFPRRASLGGGVALQLVGGLGQGAGWFASVVAIEKGVQGHAVVDGRWHQVLGWILGGALCAVANVLAMAVAFLLSTHWDELGPKPRTKVSLIVNWAPKARTKTTPKPTPRKATPVVPSAPYPASVSSQRTETSERAPTPMTPSSRLPQAAPPLLKGPGRTPITAPTVSFHTHHNSQTSSTELTTEDYALKGRQANRAFP